MRTTLSGGIHRYREQLLLGAALVLLTTLISVITPHGTAPAQSAVSYTMPAGRLMASNCFQCHGTNGQSGAFDQLAGDSAADLYSHLKDEQTKNSIMGAHAKGYTDAELKAIAAYFATVKKI